MGGSILIVDDEPKIGVMLKRALQSESHHVEYVTDPEEGLRRLKEESFDIVVTDLRMPHIDGLELLRRARSIRPACEVVMMTAHATVQTAREALKRGAVDYITKPFSIEDEMKPLIAGILGSPDSAELAETGEGLRGQALQGEMSAPIPMASVVAEAAGAPKAESDAVIRSAASDDPFARLIGRGPSMRALGERTRKVARVDSPVLLRGESGAGKEVVAGLIHELSRRAGRPFIKINCAALPETLLESELFGYTRGAFTGATTDREGLFQAADGGTLLLDEIGEISRTFQPKLLRVLQDGEFHRIGESRRTLKVDVRVIAATNRDLEEAVEGGDFRQDLYYRLNVVPIHVPPLRERVEDLPDLIDHFARQLVAEGRVPAREGRPIAFTRAALDLMRAYPWPGNVREVVNAVEYALVLSDGDEIDVADLPVAIQDHERCLAGAPVALAEKGRAGDTLEDIEMRCILQAMRKTQLNRTRAARLLGVTRRTLGYRITKYGLEDELERIREEGVARGAVPPPASPA